MHAPGLVPASILPPMRTPQRKRIPIRPELVRPDRRAFVKAMAMSMGLGAASLALPGVTACSTGRRPSFVVALADDLGYGDLGCYGHPFAKTPAIDELAANGIRFLSCYSAGANCSPARAGILTGRHPFRSGIYDWIPRGEDAHLPRDEITIASWLKRHGWATCFVGKWHLAGRMQSKHQSNPGTHGFEHWLATQNDASPRIGAQNFVLNGRLERSLGTEREPEDPAHTVVHEAVRWLETQNERDPDTPVCLFVWFHEPHRPPVTTERFRKLFADQPEPLASYYGSISHMDHAFGELLEAFDTLGYGRDSLVLFTSDNGPTGGLGSSGGLRDDKGSTYEGGIRVPCIARWTGSERAGKITNEPTIGTDVFPTLCELAGIQPPTDRPVDGRSLLPALEGGEIERDRPYFWYHPLHLYALRDGDWKLLADEAFGHVQLYDVRTDPWEKSNLASREPERVARLSNELRSLRAEVEAEGPTWTDWPSVDRLKQRLGPHP